MTYKVYPCLDKRNMGKDGRYPAKIAIGYDRKTDYIGTDVYCTQDEWADLSGLAPSNAVKEKLIRVALVQDKVKALLNTIVSYDIRTLRLLVKGTDEVSTPSETDKEVASKTNVFDWFDVKIKELEEEHEALGTAANYIDTKSFYMKQTGLSYCMFSYFSKGKLFEIQKTAMNAGMSKANVHRHARHLRHIFNIAIHERVIDRSIYPFHKRGYVIPQSRKAKKALNRDEMTLLFSDAPASPDEQRALDFFTFSYFGNGMNMKDVAYLKYTHINGNTIQFLRKKTENTAAEPQLVSVGISTEMWAIIQKYGRQEQDGYIFSIIKTGDSIKQQRLDYRNFNRVVNVHLKVITLRLGLSVKVTHGKSRHSFATALRREGVGLDYISEALSHSNTTVTKHYLSAFEDDTVAANAEKLRRYAGK